MGTSYLNRISKVNRFFLLQNTLAVDYSQKTPFLHNIFFNVKLVQKNIRQVSVQLISSMSSFTFLFISPWLEFAKHLDLPDTLCISFLYLTISKLGVCLFAVVCSEVCE